jgi:ribosomal protein L16 Arg81 hydroxylase
MSGNSDTSTANPANALAELWTRLFEQSNHQARAMLDLMRVTGDPADVQRRWLDAMAQSLDSFMRTPAFLEAMQHNLKMMTDMKVMQDRYVQDAARQVGMPLADDITGLFERLNSAEQGILGRLKAIESKLRAIESKLEAGATTT